MKKISFKNADGSLNGKLIAGIISLLIVLIQQVLFAFGVKFPGDWTSIVAVINTVLTILGMLGVVTDVQTVSAPTIKEDAETEVQSEVNNTKQAASQTVSQASLAVSQASIASSQVESAVAPVTSESAVQESQASQA